MLSGVYREPLYLFVPFVCCVVAAAVYGVVETQLQLEMSAGRLQR